ncbi:MAG TPA: hypothetical protein VGV65_04590 [Nocardioides sp.]|nr:hypothetical protein [Nocardioides sp.]
MRIGTWNLEGRWDARHLDLIGKMNCDLLLLTEVSDRVDLPEHDVHVGDHMSAKRRWAAVASRAGLLPLEAPHGASAFAEVSGVRVCSSVLPWRGCGDRPPWDGSNTAERTANTVAEIAGSRPQIWGGDWNHSLSGSEWAGSKAGRQSVLATADALGLQVPTALLPHRLTDVLSIDHIAVPATWQVSTATRVDATGLSAHDAYVIETRPDAARPAS